MLHEFKRPEDPTEEARFAVNAIHQCENYFSFVGQFGQEKANLEAAVRFQVGYFGFEVNLGQPFDVWSTEPCGLCGKTPTLHCVWKGRTIIDLGAKPTPAPGTVLWTPGEAA